MSVKGSPQEMFKNLAHTKPLHDYAARRDVMSCRISSEDTVNIQEADDSSGLLGRGYID